MPRNAILAFVVSAAVAFTGCRATHDPADDNVVRLPDGRPIAILIPPNPPSQATKLPRIVGNIHAVSTADIHAAIAATLQLGPIRFIRVKDHNTLQLHHEELGDRCLHYDDVRRKKGKWTYRTTVVVVEGCGYVPLL